MMTTVAPHSGSFPMTSTIVNCWAMARIVIQNALFFGRKKAGALVIPWATYTDSEVAHVGLTAGGVRERPDVRTLTVPFHDVDRAILDSATEGFARVHADMKGHIVGATIVARTPAK